MRATSWFTSDERNDINSFLPEMRRLKRTCSLSDTTVDEETGCEMSVAAAVRLRICRTLTENHKSIYQNLRDPKVFFRYVTLDSRLKGYFEYKLRDIGAIRHSTRKRRKAPNGTASKQKAQRRRRDSTSSTDSKTSSVSSPDAGTSEDDITKDAGAAHGSDIAEDMSGGPSLSHSTAPIPVPDRESREKLLAQLRARRARIAKKSSNTKELRAKLKRPMRVMSPPEGAWDSEIEFLGRKSPPPVASAAKEESEESESVASTSTSTQHPETGVANMSTARHARSPSHQFHARSSLPRTPHTGRTTLLLALGIPEFN